MLNTGRSYAAFTVNEKKIVASLRDKGEIFDPMSGYGSLTNFCAELGIGSFCVEYNLPQYLWQLLGHPAHAKTYVLCCNELLHHASKWPRTRLRAVASDDWFPEDSKRILFSLFEQVRYALRSKTRSEKLVDELAAGLLLPFVGRLSCSVPGDIVTHVKKGGMCVYDGWREDYRTYLLAILRKLTSIPKIPRGVRHSLIHGDARTVDLPRGRFRAFITSPPYPNHRDFVSMFAPEHAFLDLLDIPGSVTSRKASIDVIGSNFVADRPSNLPSTRTSRKFLRAIAAVSRNETAVRHDRQYYVPYFEHYFTDLESAYSNIEGSLAPSCEGYVIVVNNTHRNIVVPVAEVVMEIWKRNGFKAIISGSKEYFHVGTKNPRARGLRARHTEYVIRIWR